MQAGDPAQPFAWIACAGEGRAADGFVTAVEAIGARLAEHFPPGSGAGSRLPNHLIVLE